MPTPLSYQTFQGDGSSLNYPVAFPYLLREHVGVYVDYVVSTGAFALQLTNNAGFTWLSDTEIRLTTPILPSETLSIVRGTPADVQLVEWQDASNITADALNIAQLQPLYVLQEIADRGTVTFVAGAAQPVDIIDNLFSTRANAALSANQGRILLALINALGGGSTLDPIGTIVWRQLAPLDAPATYIYAGGEEVSRNTYFQLFGAVGTAYGAGDGVTTFNLPLEADLINPFGTGWRPFIKFGVKLAGGSGTHHIFPPRNAGTELQSWEQQTDLTWVERTTVTGLTGSGLRPWHVTANGQYWVAFNDGSTTQPPPTSRFRINGNSYSSLGPFLTNVPTGAQRVYHARFSPDGSKLAVVLRVAGATQITTIQIYTINRDTNAFTWVSQYRTDASFPPVSAIAWRNDGAGLTLLNQEASVARGFMFFAVSAGGVISLLGQQSNTAVGVGSWLSYSFDGQWAIVSGTSDLSVSGQQSVAVYAVTSPSSFNNVFSFTASTVGNIEFVEFSRIDYMVACPFLQKIFRFNPTTQQLVGWPTGGITFDSGGGGSAIPTSGAPAISWLPGRSVPTFLCDNRTYEVVNSFTQYRQIAAASNAPSGSGVGSQLTGDQPYKAPIAVLVP
jgi:hypothetical protein